MNRNETHQAQPPVSPGDEVELCITGQTHTGDGVGKTREGFTLFVPRTLAGEKVRVIVTKVKKTYAHARLKELETANSHRVDAPCPVFAACGGCQLQHVAYSHQLEIKQNQVMDAFSRIGGFSHVKVAPVLGMNNPWEYRNKAQVPFGLKQGEMVAGFYRAGSHQIVEFQHCMIQQQENDRTIQRVKKIVKDLGIPPYEENRHRGTLRHVLVRTGFYTGEIMVVLVTKGNQLPKKKKLVQELVQGVPGLVSLVHNVHTQRSNVVLGSKNHLLWGESVIHDTIGSVRFAISPHSFFQVNPEQTQVLYEQVKRYAALTGTETVLDAYCGIGTIGLYLAPHAEKVYGIEAIPQAVEDACHNAILNHMPHVTFTAGVAEEVLPRWAREGLQPDVIVIDPPRKGCEEDFLQACVAMNPKRIVYVSCNPATLARDAARLAKREYHLSVVQPVDMFPHTNHVECVTVFTPKS